MLGFMELRWPRVFRRSNGGLVIVLLDYFCCFSLSLFYQIDLGVGNVECVMCANGLLSAAHNHHFLGGIVLFTTVVEGPM